MNKNFLEHYMNTKPETNEQKYLFLVDNQDIAFAIISAGCPAIALMNGQDAYHTVNSPSKAKNSDINFSSVPTIMY